MPYRPSTDVYEIYPKAHTPPFHYSNPVTGLAPQYPRGAGRPSEAALAAVLAEREDPLADDVAATSSRQLRCARTAKGSLLHAVPARIS